MGDCGQVIQAFVINNPRIGSNKVRVIQWHLYNFGIAGRIQYGKINNAFFCAMLSAARTNSQVLF
jgi:hypothetical protein